MNISKSIQRGSNGIINRSIWQFSRS